MDKYMMFGKVLSCKVISDDKVTRRMTCGLGSLRKAPPGLRTTPRGYVKLQYRNRTSVISKLQQAELVKRRLLRKQKIDKAPSKLEVKTTSISKGGKDYVEARMKLLGQMGLSYELE